MTTTPAMPDLTAVIKWLENGCDPREAVKELKHHQSKLQALAALQAQPAAAGVSDEDIWRLWDSQDSPELSGGPCPVKFARAILALRPQAVLMTDEQRRTLVGNYFADAWAKRAAHLLLSDYDKHHGITAPAGGEK